MDSIEHYKIIILCCTVTTVSWVHVFDVALIVSLSLCPHFPVFTKLLGKRVFKRYLELFLDSPYFMDWWVIMTLEAIIYNIIQVCSKTLSVCVLCCNFNIDNVLQLFTCYPPPHTHIHTHPQSNDNALVQYAGVDCLTSLCQLLGRMILRGRIEQYNPMWVFE